MKSLLVGAALCAATLPCSAFAQQSSITQTVAGTRLDVVASGEVSRTPNVAVVSAGVVSRASDATSALQESAAKMERVASVLQHAGVSASDVQTSNVSLTPEYRYLDNQSPQLVGYNASNTVTIRFRNIKNAGKILDALVSAGANQINGPTLIVDQPELALDEARAKAVATGRIRADLYARSLGMRVVRVVSVSEADASSGPLPVATFMEARAAPAMKIEPGEQKLRVNVAMTFELQ